MPTARATFPVKFVYSLWTAVSVFGIVHLVYKALRDLQFVYSLCTQPMAAVRHPTWGNHTAGVQKCCSHQIVPHGLVNCRERLQHHTPSVQGAMGPPSLCTVCVHSLRQLYGIQLEGTVQGYYFFGRGFNLEFLSSKFLLDKLNFGLHVI